MKKQISHASLGPEIGKKINKQLIVEFSQNLIDNKNFYLHKTWSPEVLTMMFCAYLQS